MGSEEEGQGPSDLSTWARRTPWPCQKGQEGADPGSGLPHWTLLDFVAVPRTTVLEALPIPGQG